MNNEIKTVSPFRNFCITIGALPTSYLESMSYYEMLCWLCKYLENTINPAINQNAEALKELQEYVANYFDNLDVTEEINAKLDEMADDGTLAQIINVEMIGTLSNLTTEDKTDLVSAINEVNADCKLINIKQYNKNELNVITGSVQYLGNCYVTWDEESKFFKCFMDIIIDNLGSGINIIIPFPTGFNHTTNYNIGMAGVILKNGAFYDNAILGITDNGFQIYSNSTTVETLRILYNPYLYYNGVIENS